MDNLILLKETILAKGFVDENEVRQLETILIKDNIIDLGKANFLFDLNDVISGFNNHSSWNTLFINAICDFLLNDETSPGYLDDSEIKWLEGKIINDGQIDKLEQELLLTLKKKSKNFPKHLEYLLKYT